MRPSISAPTIAASSSPSRRSSASGGGCLLAHRAPGRGLGLGNRLSEGAVERTVEALRVCKGQDGGQGVARAGLVATEACRLAENGPAFIARVQDELGLDLEVVDRRTEAYLAVTGCASLADPKAQSVIVFDIGGGSTEIAWLDGRRRGSSPTRASASGPGIRFPVGVVTLAEPPRRR
jgi:exopolyphosphatase/guanosine-5'-triphosphate,3'-diphosphate pyrophosphatase